LVRVDFARAAYVALFWYARMTAANVPLAILMAFGRRPRDILDPLGASSGNGDASLRLAATLNAFAAAYPTCFAGGGFP